MEDKIKSHWPISLTNGTAALFNLFLPLVLVRTLPPEAVGRYKIFFLYVMMTPGLFLTSGLNNGLYHWTGNYPETRPEIRQSWTWLLIISLSFCAVGLPLASRFASLLGIPVFDLRLLLISGPPVVTSMFLEDLMIARGNIWLGSFYASGFNVLRSGSILAAAFWGRNMELVLWAFFLSTAVRTVAGGLILLASGDISLIFSITQSFKVLRYAVPVSIATLASQAIQNVDQMILSVRLNPVQFAFYSMGCLSVPPLEILETSINRVLIPQLSETISAGKLKEAIALFKSGLAEAFRYLLPAAAGMMIYSKPIVHILFTERYMPAAHYLRVYAVSYLLLAFPYDTVARAQGNARWILRMMLLFVPLSAIATWFGATVWGAMGALVAYLAVQLCIRLYSQAYHRKSFWCAFSEFLPVKEMMLQICVAGALGAGSIISRPLFSNSEKWFLITGPIFAVLYLGLTHFIRLRPLRPTPETINILELVQTFCLGGLERMVYSLAHTLHQQEFFKVLVVGYDHPSQQRSFVGQFKDAGIPLVYWEKGARFSPGSVARIVRLIFSQKAHILHVHDLGPLIYGSFAKFFSFGRVKLILTLHTLLHIQQNRRYRLYYRIFLRFPDRIVAVSPAIKLGLMALGVHPNRIKIVPNGAAFPPISFRDLSEKTPLRKRLAPHLPVSVYVARWMLCLARLDRAKGQENVLKIWSALPSEIRKESALFFVGQETQPGYAEFLRERIRAIGDSERVVIAGPWEYPQEWLQAADLFISGSFHEGMPLAPLEAAGSGLPIILSDIEGHRFLSPWARLFDLENAAEGARQIVEIIDTMKNEGETNFFKKHWRETESLREQWGAPAMTESYAEIFRSLWRPNSLMNAGGSA